MLLFFFSFSSLSAQDCESDKKVDWKLVEIKIMEQKDPSEEFVVNGESILKTKSSISSIEDLSESDKKKIKKTAAKYGSCLVLIDTKGLWGAAGGLYYYWVKRKE